MIEFLKDTINPKKSTSETRRREVAEKLKRLRRKMSEMGVEAVRFKGVDWFSWITAGASSVVILTSEAGIAEVLVTGDKAIVLTNRIEASRLRDEELPEGFELREFPWDDPGAIDRFVRSEVGAGAIAAKTLASDRPAGLERPLSREFLDLRLKLSPSEIDRYRALGRDAAEAMRMALARAEPGWTEYYLAGVGAREMWARGIHPTLVLVAGERRLPIYRHPLPTSEPIGSKAMMVFCARRHGLFANLTRFVAFRELSVEERLLHDQVAEVEAAAFSASKPGATTGAVIENIARAYAKIGRADEFNNHHQGGPTGYLSREEVAVPEALRADPIVLDSAMALAWNPSLPGAKIEDTVLMTDGGVEILTEDPQWPRVKIDGRRRPDVWVKS